MMAGTAALLHSKHRKVWNRDKKIIVDIWIYVQTHGKEQYGLNTQVFLWRYLYV